MYQNINDQFTASARQLADAAAQVNRLALASAGKAFGLQLSTIEENANAAFAFWGELVEVRDLDALKSVWPKGVQVARESIERSVAAGQEAFGQVVATNEAIAQITKGQVESATAQAQEAVQGAAKAAAGKARK